MVKKLIVSRKAYLNIDEIIEFNDRRNRSAIYSTKVVKGLFEKFNLLTKQPFLGKLKEQGVYRLIWDQYCIYCMIDDSQIIITSVNHRKQNIR